MSLLGASVLLFAAGAPASQDTQLKVIKTYCENKARKHRREEEKLSYFDACIQDEANKRSMPMRERICRLGIDKVFDHADGQSAVEVNMDSGRCIYIETPVGD